MFHDIFVYIIADYIVFLAIAIAIWAFLTIPKQQRFRAAARIIMAGLTALLIAKFLSVTWQPELARPYILIGAEPGASVLDNLGFPSDHAMFVTVIAVAVWAETRRKSLSIILAMIVVLVCLGRVLALVHTPLDVVAGVVVALFGGIWYLQSDKPLFKKHKQVKA